MKYRPDIDGLRTIAVVPVVIYHAGLGLPGGFVGVDVFFVISGFLITTLLYEDIEAGSFSILNFYERRARRIFPALFTMIFVTMCVSLIILTPFDLDSFSKSAISATAFVANIWFYAQEGYFTEASELKPLLHTWSLGVEEQFYVLFPILLWAIYKVFGTKPLLWVLSFLALMSFALAEILVRSNPSAAFYLPHFRAWELLLGSILAIAMARGWTLPNNGMIISAVAFLGLALIMIPIVTFGPEIQFPGLSAFFPVLGSVLLIATGRHPSSLVARVLGTAPMVFVGQLSYSLYLWHWPVIVFVYYTNGEDLSTVQGAICVIITVVISYLSWRFVEQPTRNRVFPSQNKVFAVSLSAMLVIFGLNTLTVNSDGFPARMPESFNALLESSNLLHDRRDCHFVTVDRARSNDICRRGDLTAAPVFALVGDSHADAVSPAIFAAAEKLGLSGYQFTNAGFRPLIDVSHSSSTGTQDLTTAFVEFAHANSEISVIFITAYWQHLLTGYTYRHAGDIWLDAGYDGSGSAYNVTAAKNGLRRLSEALPNIQIVLLDDIPSGPDLHFSSQLRSLRFGPEKIFGMNRSEADIQRAAYEPVLRQISKDITNISYEPFFVDICGETLCPLMEGENLLFRDGDHLSWYGALRLTNKATELLSTYFVDLINQS